MIDGSVKRPVTQPRLIRRDCGGWLAISDAESAIRIGAIGLTANEAREEFEGRMRTWTELLGAERQ